MCDICGNTISTKIKKGYHIDHNHVTGKVRGILCAHCNQGLGHFRDNILFLENAINYLKGENNAA